MGGAGFKYGFFDFILSSLGYGGFILGIGKMRKELWFVFGIDCVKVGIYRKVLGRADDRGF